MTVDPCFTESSCSVSVHTGAVFVRSVKDTRSSGPRRAADQQQTETHLLRWPPLNDINLWRLFADGVMDDKQ